MGTGGYLAVIIVGSWVGYIVSAYLNDAIGRRKNFFIFAIGSLIIAVAYTQAEISNSMMLVLGFPLGFFASGIFSGMGPVLTELFPTSVRGAGQGFCYNFGRGIGAFFPTLVGTLSATVPLGTAIGIFAAMRLCHGHRRRIDAAGDARPGAAGELKRARRRQRTAHGPAVSLSMLRHRPFGRQRTNSAWRGNHLRPLTISDMALPAPGRSRVLSPDMRRSRGGKNCVGKPDRL